MKKTNVIYIVEDDSIAAIIANEVLKRNKVQGEVQNYLNGEQAFTQLLTLLPDEENIPELILLDLNMPFMDGWDFLRAFEGLQIKKQVAVFVLTSSIRPDDRERAMGFEAVKGYFVKPLGDAAVAYMQEFLGA